MLPQQISIFTETESTALSEGFRANLSPTLEKDLERKILDTCGRTLCVQLERFGQVGLWAKTFTALLIGQTDWCLTRSKLIWKLRATRCNLMYIQLAVQARPTKEIESSLLPTVTASTGGGSAKDTKNKRGIHSGNPLKTMANMGLLPTPEATMIHHKDRVQKQKDAGVSLKSRVNGNSRPNGLIDHLDFHGLLPTPMAQSRQTTKEKTEARQAHYGGTKRAMYLENFAALGMLPTPKVGGTEGYATRAKRQGHAKAISHLEAFVDFHTGMLPTPQAGEGFKITGKENQDSLTKRARSQTGKTSQLNPRFVAEMMGFPVNWTELPFLNGATKP